MSAEHRASFFDGVQEHSQIKLRALERYLPPWSAKVGSRRGVKRVWVVDGFAGPGVYESGEAGSPRIVLDYADRIHAEDRPYRVSAFFAEDDKRRHRALTSESNRHPQIEAICGSGNFWSLTDEVVQFVGSDPALVFVDPFGLGDLKFRALVDLCNRLPKVDLMVNFASPVAKRLQPNHQEIITEAVGNSDWTIESITEVFCEGLSRECGFLKPAVLPVMASLSRQALKYEIVLAARKRDAYELWSDEISSSQRDILDGEDQAEKQELLEKARGHLRFVVGETFTRDQLIKDIQFHQCGDFHSRVLRAAVKAMLVEGEWEQDPGSVRTARIRKVSH